VSRPLIGIPAQTLQAIDGIPAGLPHSWAMNARYYTAVADTGGAPVMVPLLTRDADALRAVYDQLDGVLLAGGVDMDPESFGEQPHPRLGRTDPARDAVELQLARWAVEDRKPILGLCRGHQVLNVALGGTLWQDIAAQVPRAVRHDYFPTAGYATSPPPGMPAITWPTKSRWYPAPVSTPCSASRSSGSTACITRRSRLWPRPWSLRAGRRTTWSKPSSRARDTS